MLEKALKVAPRHVDALVLVGGIAGLEGRLAEAEAIFKRALEIEPRTTSAWAALVRLRRMTPADDAWLKGAEAGAANMNTPLEEANIRFALGKYFDDIADFRRAFRSYQRANELQKAAADAYDREGREHFVDDLIRVYTREALSQARGCLGLVAPGVCDWHDALRHYARCADHPLAFSCQISRGAAILA